MQRPTSVGKRPRREEDWKSSTGKRVMKGGVSPSVAPGVLFLAQSQPQSVQLQSHHPSAINVTFKFKGRKGKPSPVGDKIDDPQIHQDERGNGRLSDPCQHAVTESLVGIILACVRFHFRFSVITHYLAHPKYYYITVHGCVYMRIPSSHRLY
jgi:hypothetical protein